MARGPEDGVSHGDLLWKVIGRYDSYLGATNAKTALATAFNAFVVGSIVLKWSDIVTQFAETPALARVVAALLAVATLGALASLWFAFTTVTPYLQSPRVPQKYHSILFFEHVADHPQPELYLAAVHQHGRAEVEKELATQAHTLARGLKEKFRASSLAVAMIRFVQLPCFALIVLIKLALILFVQS